jgi:hypothetical protein
VTDSGFPESGIPLKNLGICMDCAIAFRASDGQCPQCATVVGWALLPKKFLEESEPVSPTDKEITKV